MNNPSILEYEDTHINLQYNLTTAKRNVSKKHDKRRKEGKHDTALAVSIVCLMIILKE
jgi:hypothetical protein